MSRHPIDNLFRSQLAQHREAPPMHIWERVEAHRRKQRMRRLYWKGGTLATVLLGGSLLAFLWQPVEKTPTLAAFPVAETPPPTRVVEPLTTQAAITATLIPDAAVTTLAESTADLVVPAASNSAATNTMNGKTTTPNASSPNSSAISEEPQKKPKRNTPKQQRVQAQKPSKAVEPKAKAVTPSIPTPATAPVRRSEQRKPSGPHLRDRSLAPRVVEPLPPRPHPWEVNESQPLPEVLPEARCATFAPQGLFVQVELLGGPSFGQPHFSAPGSEANSHLADRLATESGGLSLSAQLRVSIRNRSGWTVRGGLSYAELRNSFRMETEGEHTLTIRERYDANGNVIGRDTSYESTSYSIDRTNRYRLLEIPLAIGYEFGYRRMRFGIHGGPLINLHFNPSGHFVSPVTNQPIAFGQEGDVNAVPAYRDRVDIGFYGGLVAIYPIGGRFQLLAEPFFKTYPSSLTRPEYALTQTAWQSGLQLGLRMQL